ncbi:hypothetical protein DWF00_19710 [Bosea caraganae]|uniref:Cytochrome c domain-containing protein n=1 Tax=Bosea caraganae TaxID=2763117 RepID=A0A370KXL4_9HYPH|nr:c-type cytochrome [Bosea caraganae]RDJ19708.1 hypothetical protein DWE98_28475 [Bosea caraganae]RDJ24352.1 hypothetical protein DWF00_19710 [Bosea caraganae]
MFRLLLALAVLLAQPVAAQELRGHGGPVRALAVSPDGNIAISGSFDTSAILWDLARSQALAVLRGHDSSVNAVAALPDGRFATGGEDGRVLLWRIGRPEPEARLEGHSGPIASLAPSPDGKLLASASWDGTARVTPLASGEAVVISGHRGPVSAVAFAPDGSSVVTGGHDGTIRITPLNGGVARSIDTGQPVAGLVVAPDGEIVAGGADGRLIFLAADGPRAGEVTAAETPIVALALSPDGRRIAAAGIRGSVAIVERASRRVERVLVGPGLPVWSLAFRPGSDELLTGGGDRVVRRWNAATGEHLGAVVMTRPSEATARFADHPGAEVFRACSACHTLDADGGNRAGPTLYGVIGRRIATAPGYDYSPGLRGMTIVWSKETIAKLFELGPNAYTPGTKMPEQRVVDPDDRKALVDFIAKATGAE